MCVASIYTLCNCFPFCNAIEKEFVIVLMHFYYTCNMCAHHKANVCTKMLEKCIFYKMFEFSFAVDFVYIIMVNYNFMDNACNTCVYEQYPHIPHNKYLYIYAYS